MTSQIQHLYQQSLKKPKAPQIRPQITDLQQQESSTEIEEEQPQPQQEEINLLNPQPKIKKVPFKIERKNNNGFKPKQNGIQKLQFGKKPGQKPITNMTKTKKRMQMPRGGQILEVSMPQEIAAGIRFKNKRFAVQIKYSAQGAIRSKKIFFGHRQKQYYIDHRDRNKAARDNGRLLHIEDPFHPNYWVFSLLNSGPDLRENYINYIKTL